MTIAERPHGRSRYNAGCRCGECRTANRDHARRRRAKRLQPVPPPAAEGLPVPELSDGAVTAAVRAQIECLGGAERPGLAAVAVALARVLDNPTAVPQHPSAAHRLSEVLDRLGKSQPRRGRLSAVRGLTGG